MDERVVATGWLFRRSDCFAWLSSTLALIEMEWDGRRVGVQCILIICTVSPNIMGRNSLPYLINHMQEVRAAFHTPHSSSLET